MFKQSDIYRNPWKERKIVPNSKFDHYCPQPQGDKDNFVPCLSRIKKTSKKMLNRPKFMSSNCNYCNFKIPVWSIPNSSLFPCRQKNSRLQFLWFFFSRECRLLSLLVRCAVVVCKGFEPTTQLTTNPSLHSSRKLFSTSITINKNRGELGLGKVISIMLVATCN